MSTSHTPQPDSLIEAEKCKQYWETVDSNDNGMLGGVLSIMPSVSRIDLQDQVDVVEPVVKFTDVLKGKPGVGEIHNVGLEQWRPSEGASYDLIWIQWCIGHLNDEEVVQFLERCKSVLDKEHGIIVFKENLSTWGQDKFDELDGSVTREDEKFQQLFKRAGLKIIKSDMQRGFPVVKNRQLLPLKMYALQPESTT
ncbi:hypothetical protein FPOAC1_002533 [Fusarium poae]|uniref:hypothetical protein n=1 Tax=Fusarium poae TaxID=36050 RepID=UPI001CE9DA63|nr:hypothetical protein FPOAC1_002533 [Fusarium poae]KAG8676528.1 hypothetical protein FPOAC1_002533 [Fusarium poae]